MLTAILEASAEEAGPEAPREALAEKAESRAPGDQNSRTLKTHARAPKHPHAPSPQSLQNKNLGDRLLSSLPAPAANDSVLFHGAGDEEGMRSVINLPLNTDFSFLFFFFFSFLAKHIKMLQEDWAPSAKRNKEALSRGNGRVMANKAPS